MYLISDMRNVMVWRKGKGGGELRGKTIPYPLSVVRKWFTRGCFYNQLRVNQPMPLAYPPPHTFSIPMVKISRILISTRNEYKAMQGTVGIWEARSCIPARIFVSGGGGGGHSSLHKGRGGWGTVYETGTVNWSNLVR